MNSESNEKIYPILKTDLITEKLTESLTQSLIQKEINKINSFNNHIQNIKDMKDYFVTTTRHNKKMYKHYKHLGMLVNVLESIVIIGTTSTSIIVGLVGLAPFIIPIATGGGISTTLLNKVVCEKLKKNEKNYLKMYTLTSKYLEEFTSFHRKALEDNVIEQNEYKKLCGIFNKYVNEARDCVTSVSKGKNTEGCASKSFLVGTPLL